MPRKYPVPIRAVNIYLTEEQIAMIDQFSEDLGISKGAALRQLLMAGAAVVNRVDRRAQRVKSRAEAIERMASYG